MNPIEQNNEELISAEERLKMFDSTFDDAERIRENIIERRQIMIQKELRFRKFLAQLALEGYSHSDIQKILRKGAPERLIDMCVEKYDLSGAPDPDMSDLM